jgi:hypothetical protein
MDLMVRDLPEKVAKEIERLADLNGVSRQVYLQVS